MLDKKAKVIAYYLPQFHPTPNNDKWWGKGFTEWTNVAKAKPLFKGHYQPKVPADLGFYDLRLPEVREAQAQMAMESGIEGFCYYHYWFGDGRQELDTPFKEVLRLGQPTLPFCLCWANESWYAKLWRFNSTKSKKLLIEQKYLGTNDNLKHFTTLLPSFYDERYIKIDGKPVFVIYKPLKFVNVKQFIHQWNEEAIKHGLNGVHFVGYTLEVEEEYEKIMGLGFEAVNSCKVNRFFKHENFLNSIHKRLGTKCFKIPYRQKYSEAMKYFIGEFEKKGNVYPSIIPNWDHTPRSGHGGYLLTNSSPNLFDKHVKNVFKVLDSKPMNNRICFLKSWNEWGEGNYVEPDLKFGRGYLNVLRDNLFQ